MIKLYKPTTLEEYISELFIRLRILEPQHIDENYISKKLNIHLEYSLQKPYAYEDDDIKIINLYMNSTKKEQREQFYHELCHHLRHAGYQLVTNKLFREWQEWDSNKFVLLAAIPYHMLNHISLNDCLEINKLSNTFGVPEELCEKRVEYIYNRIEARKLEGF